jgi:beta-ureidopropionase / N-carbamoyl-L-amino-acid hydrolase
MTAITINPQRLLADLQTLRGIGAVGKGVVRQAYTAHDIEARRWLSARMRAAELEPCWDEVGNVFALPPHTESAILIGSHSDTQPEGGWLDGAYGVICGLEIARAAQEAGVGRVACVAFADEEGAFNPMLGSRCWTGALPLERALALSDSQGHELGAILAGVPEIRAAGRVPLDRFRAFIEPHVEQGPVLDRAGENVAVVSAIAGVRQLDLVFTGEQNHAGATPMEGRRDALRGFVRYVTALDSALESIASDAAVWTIGALNMHPNAVSIIPSRVAATLQIRDVTTAGLEAMLQTAIGLAEQQSDLLGVSIEARPMLALPPVDMALDLASELAAAAAEQSPGRWRRMSSGALHDAAIVSAKLPTAMIFTPSLLGRSHSFDEDTHPDHLVLGCSVVAAAVSRLLS